MKIIATFLILSLALLTACGGPQAPQALRIEQPGDVVGQITDRETGDPIIGASVQVFATTLGARTNTDGYFRISGLIPGKYTLRITTVEYKNIELGLMLTAAQPSKFLHIELDQAVIDLDSTITVETYCPPVPKKDEEPG